MYECFYCGGMFCDSQCDGALNADQEDIDRHVANCTVDGFCYVCQCM